MSISELDREAWVLENQHGWLRRIQGGPMLLATRWSLKAGKRHRITCIIGRKQEARIVRISNQYPLDKGTLMTESTLLAKFTVANNHAEEMRRVFSHYGEGLISESAEESVHVYQSLDSPNEFWIYEYYPNERVAASHKESGAVSELREAMKNLKDAPTEVHNLRPVFQYSPTP